MKLEAGEQAQKVIDDVLKLSVVNSKGEMVPFSSFTQIEQKLGMDQICLLYTSGSMAPFNHSFGTECPAAGRKIIECTLAGTLASRGCDVSTTASGG